MMNPSAPIWLIDEVQTTLKSLHKEFEGLSGTRHDTSDDSLIKKLHLCEGLARSVSGAMGVAAWEPVLRYTSRLQEVLHFLSEAPSLVSSEVISQLQKSAWSLSDFLLTVNYTIPCSELSLYPCYQNLARLLSINSHPMELWATEEQTATIESWSHPDALLMFKRQVTQGLTLHPHQVTDLLEQADEYMLGLLRHQKAENSSKLQSLCHWRISQSDTGPHILAGTLLVQTFSALDNGYLELDVFLKRYLLGSLRWLKGQDSEPERLLNEAAFFNYVAWLRVPANMQPELAKLADLAKWSPRRNGDYGQLFPTQFDRTQLLGVQSAIEEAKHQWAQWCSRQDLSQETIQITSEVLVTFDQLKNALEVVHPSSHTLSATFQHILRSQALYARQPVRVEVATTLLLLNSLATDMYALAANDIDHQFNDLNQRLENVSQEKYAGDFQPWMLEYQQRLGWKSAMTSAVEHLTQNLNEIENIFKQLWSTPANPIELFRVSEKLRQMRSIAQSLDLHQYVMIVDSLDTKIAPWLQSNQAMDFPAQHRITSDLAALGLQLHMWAHQSAPPVAPVIATAAPLAIPTAPLGESELDFVDSESSMIEVFLVEAQELLPDAQLAIQKLQLQSEDSEALAVLRRAFHTLKGSARIVGLMEFGEAAWLVEKHLNESLTDGQSIPKSFLSICETQLATMQTWVRQLEANKGIAALELDWGLEQLATSIQSLQMIPLFELPPPDLLDLPALPEISTEPPEKQMKSIGDLQISIPLYQAFLNETDEWSRQLALAMSEWAVDDRVPIHSQAHTWAHALAGSAATVGFTGCSRLAKVIEQLIEKIQTQNFYSLEISKSLASAADDIRRLLHQFAAGFLKEPDPMLLAHLEFELAEPVSLPVTPIKADANVVDAELRAIFQEESSQLTSELGAALRSWANSPDQQAYKTQALRVLHTLKGSARLVSEQSLAQSAHDLESHIEALGSTPSADNLNQLLVVYDRLAGHLAQPAQAGSVAPKSSLTAMPLVTTAASGETIRVQSNTVERLVNQTGEIMIARARMEAEMSRSLRTLTDMGLHVQRLRDQLRELELQTESQLQSRQAQVGDAVHSFDPLELDRFTRTQELTRFMAETLGDFSTLQRSLQRSMNATEDDLAAQLRQTRDLQRHLLRTRMVEFESISERLHRLVRMTSQELGKTVELTIQNSRQEMDRAVLDRMLPAFEHLLRNSIVHGIETPAARELKGKSRQGKIEIHLTQQSNDVIVILNDDGQGINQTALIQKAKQLAPNIDIPASPIDLIFMSGLSTASEVSELAGRGIGLDVVRAQVQALGGRIEVRSANDTGTTFKLILPLTTVVTQIVLVRSGAFMTGIPGNLVISVVRAKLDDVNKAILSGQFISGAQSYPFYRLHQLLQYKAVQVETEQSTQPIMLLQSAGQVIALHIDEVLGNQEVMIKNLGAQLATLPALSGMTVLPTGATVFIYNPVALASVYGPRLLTAQKHENEGADAANRSIELTPPVSVAPPKPSPLVLVVDDSITMRRVLQRLLQREGYRVSLAADGRQALESLRLEKPMLVLSDVEMPRMDGFELLQNIRTSDRLSDIPVVMITSRIADKHREHAQSLGVNAYLGKPYSEEELIKLLNHYAKK